MREGFITNFQDLLGELENLKLSPQFNHKTKTLNIRTKYGKYKFSHPKYCGEESLQNWRIALERDETESVQSHQEGKSAVQQTIDRFIKIRGDEFDKLTKGIGFFQGSDPQTGASLEPSPNVEQYGHGDNVNGTPHCLRYSRSKRGILFDRFQRILDHFKETHETEKQSNELFVALRKIVETGKSVVRSLAKISTTLQGDPGVGKQQEQDRLLRETLDGAGIEGGSNLESILYFIREERSIRRFQVSSDPPPVESSPSDQRDKNSSILDSQNLSGSSIEDEKQLPHILDDPQVLKLLPEVIQKPGHDEPGMDI